MSTLNTESVFNLTGFSLDTCSLDTNAYWFSTLKFKMKSGLNGEEREDTLLLFHTVALHN